MSRGYRTVIVGHLLMFPAVTGLWGLRLSTGWPDVGPTVFVYATMVAVALGVLAPIAVGLDRSGENRVAPIDGRIVALPVGIVVLAAASGGLLGGGSGVIVVGGAGILVASWILSVWHQSTHYL